MSDHRYTDTCARCGHIEYHHRPECELIHWETQRYCDCLAFVEQTGGER